MPPRRCCCDGPCFIFRDEFDRADSTDLGSDWQECVGDWEIVSQNLTTTDTGAVVVLKHMVGNPVGILRGEVKFYGCTGAIYRIYVFYGTESTPCESGSEYIVEIEVVDDENGIVRILGGDIPQESEVWIDQEEDLEFSVCVSLDSIEVKTDARSTDFVEGNGFLVICDIEPTKYWFALGSESSTQGYWPWVEYEDHRDHNPDCPRCSPAACFPLDEQVIVGFDFEITVIGDGDQCDCPETFAFQMMVPYGTNPCAAPVESDIEEIPLPGTGGIFCGEALAIFVILCDDTGISISLLIQPQEGTLVLWVFTFPPGTPVASIGIIDGPVTDAGDGKVCDFANALLTVTPILSDSCCGEAS